MDRRYQVFVSSTYQDLQEERSAVMQALLGLDCIPTGMELFPAADEDSWTLIKEFVAGCDYYLVIVGGRYGSSGPSGKSYTEMEYDFAIEQKIPVLAFLHKDPSAIPAGKTEPNDQGKTSLVAFRNKIETARHARYWDTAAGLAAIVTHGMVSLIKAKPRIGWVRANLVPDEGAAQEMLKLRRRIEELEATIADVANMPPPGTETLAQGEETIGVHFKFEVDSQYRELEETFSWDEIFALLGPLLITSATDNGLKTQLASAFVNRFRDKNHGSAYRATVRDEDFQRIKVQLRALGLVRGAPSPSGDLPFWTLTPYGDYLLTEIAAVRSEQKKPDHLAAS